MAKAGDLEAGISQLQHVVNENVNADSVPFAFLRLGSLLQDKGDWRGAADQFLRATKLRPNYTEAHNRLAYSLAHEGRRSEALSEYDRVAKLSTSEVDRRYSQVLANQWLGNALREQGNHSAAASVYREAIRLKPDYRAAHCELGLVHEQQGRLGQAIQEYRVAAAAESKELDSSDWRVLAHLRLGEALVREGGAHQAEGIVELQEATKIDPKHLASYFCLGKVLYDQGNFVEASSNYRQAMKINLKSAVVHDSLALALDKQGLVKEATLEYRDAINLEPNNAVYHAHLTYELDLQNLNKEAAAERDIVAKLNSAAIATQQGVGFAQGQAPRCEDLR